MSYTLTTPSRTCSNADFAQFPALLFRKVFNMDRSYQQCHQARAKVRANDARLTYVWSTLELTKSLLIVGKTLFLGNGAGCDFGSNLRCASPTKDPRIQWPLPIWNWL